MHVYLGNGQKERKMGSPQSPGGRVIGNFRYQGSLHDGRLGPLTGGQGHQNSYSYTYIHIYISQFTCIIDAQYFIIGSNCQR